MDENEKWLIRVRASIAVIAANLEATTRGCERILRSLEGRHEAESVQLPVRCVLRVESASPVDPI